MRVWVELAITTEAKQRNPGLVMYGLPWSWPGWVGGGGGSPSKTLSLPVGYIVD